MKKVFKSIILLIFSLIITMTVGCSRISSKTTFTIENFKIKMTEKNYNFKIEDVAEDFLPATRKIMTIGDDRLTIYIFSSDKKMEKEAKFISSDGFGYNNGSQGVSVDWVSEPHFYKKGNIIVQYVGTNEKIISDLKAILGEQFAGME